MSYTNDSSLRVPEGVRYFKDLIATEEIALELFPKRSNVSRDSIDSLAKSVKKATGMYNCSILVDTWPPETSLDKVENLDNQTTAVRVVLMSKEAGVGKSRITNYFTIGNVHEDINGQPICGPANSTGTRAAGTRIPVIYMYGSGFSHQRIWKSEDQVENRMRKLNYTLEKKQEIRLRGLGKWGYTEDVVRPELNPHEPWTSAANQYAWKAHVDSSDPDEFICYSHDIVQFPFPMMAPTANKTLYDLVDLPGHSGSSHEVVTLNDIIIQDFLSEQERTLHVFACVSSNPREFSMEQPVKMLLDAGVFDLHRISAHLVQIYSCKDLSEEVVSDARIEGREYDASVAKRSDFKEKLEEWFRPHISQNVAWSYYFNHCISRGGQAAVISNQFERFVYSERKDDKTATLFRDMVDRIALHLKAELVDTHISIACALLHQLLNKVAAKPSSRNKIFEQFRSQVSGSFLALSIKLRDFSRSEDIDSLLDRLDITENLPTPNAEASEKRNYLDIFVNDLDRYLQIQFSNAVEDACSVADTNFQNMKHKIIREHPKKIDQVSEADRAKWRHQLENAELLINNLQSKYRPIQGHLDHMGPGLNVIREEIKGVAQDIARTVKNEISNNGEPVSDLIFRAICNEERGKELSTISDRCKELLMDVVANPIEADKKVRADLRKSLRKLKNPSGLILPRNDTQDNAPAFTDVPAISRSGTRLIPT